MTRSFCLLLTALLCACAARTPVSPISVQPRAPESEEAQAIYAYLASQEYLQERRPADAAQALEKAISIASAPELYMELGNLYWRSSRLPDAVRILKQGSETYPEFRPLLAALAKAYATQGRFDDAVLTLDDYLAKNPQTPDRLDILHEAAAFRMEERRFDDAVDRLAAIPKNETTPVTSFLLGKALAGLGMPDRAIAQFRRAVAKDPEYFDAWVELGLTYEAQKNYVEAERVFSRLLDSEDGNPQLVLKLADIRLKLNDPDQALAVVRQYPEETELLLDAASLFITQGFPEHAEQLLEPLTRQTPIPADALLQLAILEYESRENPSKALDYLEAVPAGHPHYERALLFRVHLLYQMEREKNARDLCREAMAKFPRQPEFPLILAELDGKAGNLPAALDTLVTAAAAWPDHTDILYRLGLLHDRMDHREQALDTMEKIIATDPEHADALNFLGYTLAEENRDLERAETLIRNALRIKPDNGYYLDSLAWVYFRQGKIREAWQEIRRAISFVETDAVIWEHYGDIAAALGLPGEARKGYSASLSLEDNARVQGKLNGLDRK